MPIRPIEINGAISRVQDIGAIKQNEDNKPLVDQSKFQTHLEKEVDHHQKTVREADNSDNYQKKYDAKEKGNGTYFAKKKNKRDNKKQNEKNDKEQEAKKSFDIRI